MEHDFSKIAHEIWAAVQLFPGEGIEDGTDRIEIILKETFVERPNKVNRPDASKCTCEVGTNFPCKFCIDKSHEI